MPEITLLDFPNLEPPADLLDKVVGKIHAARLRQIRVRLALAASALFGSLAYASYQRTVIWTELGQSSFFQFVRLIWSDSDIALANAKDLALGLLETIPVESILLTLVSAFALLVILASASAWRHERHLIPTHSVV